MFQAAFGVTDGTRYTWNTENRLVGVERLAPSAGDVKVQFAYDPYGKRINTASPGEYDQPYRFSTKPVDEETGLGYWIKRYYSYDLGRWVSRDPIGERGGVNLYTYVENGPVLLVDAFGWHPRMVDHDPWSPTVDPPSVDLPGDGIKIQDCSEEWQDRIGLTLKGACDHFDKLADKIKANKECVQCCLEERVEKGDDRLPHGISAERVLAIIKTATDYWCGKNAKGVFKCRESSKGGNGTFCKFCASENNPSMLTPPLFVRWGYSEQPIHICIENDCPDCVNVDNMIHEMLRQWFGDSRRRGPNEGWDYAIGVGGQLGACVRICESKK